VGDAHDHIWMLRTSTAALPRLGRASRLLAVVAVLEAVAIKRTMAQHEFERSVARSLGKGRRRWRGLYSPRPWRLRTPDFSSNMLWTTPADERPNFDNRATPLWFLRA
jgi:hypothetical protein